MIGLIWSGPAQDDLVTIADFYVRFDPALAQRYLEQVANAPLILREFPKLGAVTQIPGVRKWRVPETPFVLLYAIGPDRVEVRRVRHERSDWPGHEPS